MLTFILIAVLVAGIPEVHKPVNNFLPKQLSLEKCWLVTNMCHNGFNKLMIMIKKPHNHGVSWVQGRTHHAGVPGQLCWKETF